MTLRSVNPHDQSLLGEIPITGREDVAATIHRARESLSGWAKTSLSERADIVRRYQQTVLGRRDELARLICLEMGKPLKQAQDEIDLELEYLAYYADHAEANLGSETVRHDETGQYRITLEPYGVVACIAPWNFPLVNVNSGVVPALLAGNTVVFKPSELSTLSQGLAVDLLHASGMPEDVLGLVTGEADTGQALVEGDVDFVWFTGSTKVGREIYRSCGARFIKAICELGGSSPGILFADADLDAALESVYWSRFLNCGQVCDAVKRLFVERQIFSDVVDALVKRVQDASIGNPVTNPDFGPLVSRNQLAVLEGQIDDAVKQGAVVHSGGIFPAGAECEGGNYIAPTVLTRVKPEMRVMREETFGPVLPIIPFDDDQTAVLMANDTDYGLSAAIYTSNGDRAERIARQLACGVVGINTHDYYKPQCPIGGYKDSGMGREYGRVGMQEFAQLKVLATASR